MKRTTQFIDLFLSQFLLKTRRTLFLTGMAFYLHLGGLAGQSSSYSYSLMCSAVQGGTGLCTNSSYQNVFRLTENVYSWITFIDPSPENFVIRHEWYSMTSPFIPIWEYENTYTCCNTMTSYTSRPASLLGPGEYFVRFYVRLESSPDFIELSDDSGISSIYRRLYAIASLNITDIGHTGQIWEMVTGSFGMF
ncbi:MAG: hypothetical protein H6569_13875 [Lewinellaceae bacterium]|nr:hypothetical protein [Lewinellaceae bacterium]